MIKRFIQTLIRRLMMLLPKSALLYLHRVISRILSPEELTDAIMTTIKEQVRTLDPKTGLQFLFTIDAALYPLESQGSVNYGNGIHTKHRHMQYHKFFTDRISSDDIVLDMGCGIGALAFSIATETGATVLGLDYDPQNIKFAKERHVAPNVDYIVADIYDYVPQQAFNLVVLSNVLEHLEDRPALLRLIQEKTQAQRFLIRVPRFDRHWSVPLKKELGVEWRLDTDHKTEFTPESFKEEMAQANLQIDFIDYRWDEIWADLSILASN
ncbi:MAG: class I SAM-dependent methyltransferase [Phototrophicaceae bacterium]